MTFSPLADMRYDIPAGNRWNPRQSPIVGVTWHGQAGVNQHGEATNPAREVSANYWISNEGVIMPQVEEEYRAWTTGAVGYPAGAESDHRNITMEISNSPEGVANGTWAISAAAYDAALRLTAEIFARRKLGAVRRGTHGGVAVHRDFVATECPGGYIMTHLGSMIAGAEKIRLGGSASTAPGTKPVNPELPTSTQVLAQQVLAGVYGDGQARRNALGDRYDEVQAEVNRLLGIQNSTTPSNNISQLADAVERGEYGNGEERRRRLGSNYGPVQAEVDRRYAARGSQADARIVELARRTRLGDFGNGQERANRLGSDYAAVMAEVNRQLYG